MSIAHVKNKDVVDHEHHSVIWDQRQNISPPLWLSYHPRGGIYISGDRMACLLWADDLVLLSDSASNHATSYG